ncbi:MAG: ParB N-terminal domain-containing protein [Phycisphaerales bacterium]|nr:ParB N-terminal domain-containing protein [Phycisphaerales bacterium]
MSKAAKAAASGLDVVMQDIGTIRPYAANPRRNDDAVDEVARSIQEFGFRQPIVVDSEGVIIIGHTRYRAAKKLGMQAVPVHVAGDLAPERVRALRIADNRTHELSEWDDDLLAKELRELDRPLVIGFDDDELAKLLDDDEPAVRQLDVSRKPPAMTWVLIGLPTVRFGEVAAHLDHVAHVDGVTFETCVSSELEGEPNA